LTGRSLWVCSCRQCAIKKSQAVKSRRERILFVDRRARSAMARAQKAISAIFCQSANPTRDTICCIVSRLCGLRPRGSVEYIQRNVSSPMSITAKANLPKLQVFRRVTFGLDSERIKEWSGSSPGSTSRIVCNPRVRSSPAFSINLACRVRLSSISSVVAA